MLMFYQDSFLPERFSKSSRVLLQQAAAYDAPVTKRTEMFNRSCSNFHCFSFL